MKKSLFFICIFLTSFLLGQIKQDTLVSPSAVEDTIISAEPSPEDVVTDIENLNATPNELKIISPTKAGLYSALLPGLGQMYNRKYWKIPIVLGAIGTGVGITIWNDNQYKRYRKAFVASLNGQEHEFSNIPGITSEVLGRTQDRAKRQRDYAIAITAAVYILNIIDAVVDAHLAPMKNDPDIALVPTVIEDKLQLESGKPGLALVFKF